jgi:hypothetical protein
MRAKQESDFPWQRIVFGRVPGNKLGAVETYEVVPGFARHPNVTICSLCDRGISARKAVLCSPGGVAVLGYASSWIERLRVSLVQQKEKTNQVQAEPRPGFAPDRVLGRPYSCPLLVCSCFALSRMGFRDDRQPQAQPERESRPVEKCMAGEFHM